MLITFGCYLPFPLHLPSFTSFVRAHTQVSAVVDWERPGTERKQVRLPEFLLSSIYWVALLCAGPNQVMGGMSDVSSQIQWNPWTKSPLHCSRCVWDASLPLVLDQESRWLGRATVLRSSGQEKSPPAFTEFYLEQLIEIKPGFFSYNCVDQYMLLLDN